jgi:23S rRNA G2069 N7-methylase RlmK/C1962 C5-methylase RlmI
MCRCEFICIKIEEYLDEIVEDEMPLFDVVILDPPKLAPAAKMLPRALNKYESLNIAAMKVLTDGGLLMTCSCSGAVAQSKDDVFSKTVATAARKLRRQAIILREAGAGPDHPLDPVFPQGRYLSNKLVRVTPR